MPGMLLFYLVLGAALFGKFVESSQNDKYRIEPESVKRFSDALNVCEKKGMQLITYDGNEDVSTIIKERNIQTAWENIAEANLNIPIWANGTPARRYISLIVSTTLDNEVAGPCFYLLNNDLHQMPCFTRKAAPALIVCRLTGPACRNCDRTLQCELLKCYRTQKAVSYYNSQDICRRSGMDLASLSMKDLFQVLKRISSKDFQMTMFGLQTRVELRRHTEASFKTHHLLKRGCGVIIFRPNNPQPIKRRVVSCDEQHHFICKKVSNIVSTTTVTELVSSIGGNAEVTAISVNYSVEKPKDKARETSFMTVIIFSFIWASAVFSTVILLHVWVACFRQWI